MSPLSNLPPYRIVTARLVLRCWNPADAPLLAAAISESVEHLLPWMPFAANEPEPLAEKIARLRRMRANFDRGEDFVYGIFDAAEQRVLGGTGLHTRVGEGALEIGYWIHREAIGQGLATELAGALTRTAFEICGVNRMEIHCSVENQRSAAVPRKLGYVHEGNRRRLSQAYGRPTDQMTWTMFADEFPASPAARCPYAAYDAAGRLLRDSGKE